MSSLLVATWMILTASACLAPTPSLELPTRSTSAMNGKAFARLVSDLSLEERERSVEREVLAGNVPNVFRKFAPVEVVTGEVWATYWVTSEYLAIGSNEDYVIMPISPCTAQHIADKLGCVLPTKKMVDDIYGAATTKLTPLPIPPSPEMTKVHAFLRHNDIVLEQRGGKPPSGLVAGHKKDVVVTNRLADRRGKVAIYGWHQKSGRPIQPLYTGHTAAWVDYSHGIRLVRREMMVGGERKTTDQVLTDATLFPLLSDEGRLVQTRYDCGESPRGPETPDLKAAPGEAVETVRFKPGVRVVVNRPAKPSGKPILLIFYALPNGNTIEWTAGKTLKPGDDPHFDFQQIAAQTRFLREAIFDRDVIVVYLENDLKSWPAWRKKWGDVEIPKIIAKVRDQFGGPRSRIVLNGHSGGGSLIFGYLNQVDSIPDEVERVVFLDSNYAYETSRHLDKFVGWLKASNRHSLHVFAYDDAVALLNGKAFVSVEGGTWGRSRLMKTDLERFFPFDETREGHLRKLRASRGRLRFDLLDNPDRKVLHTVQVERNGFIESVLAGTNAEELKYKYLGERAYSKHVRSD